MNGTQTMNERNYIQVQDHIYMSQSVTSSEDLERCIFLFRLQTRQNEQKLET